MRAAEAKPETDKDTLEFRLERGFQARSALFFIPCKCTDKTSCLDLNCSSSLLQTISDTGSAPLVTSFPVNFICCRVIENMQGSMGWGVGVVVVVGGLFQYPLMEYTGF